MGIISIFRIPNSPGLGLFALVRRKHELYQGGINSSERNVSTNQRLEGSGHPESLDKAVLPAPHVNNSSSQSTAVMQLIGTSREYWET